jgi:3-methyl-2-oxobutanoate hydroxymethyltransferase
MLTAYDYPTALAMDKAGVDSILVGDSLGMVVLGYENTLPVTMERCSTTVRPSGAARYALLIGDMFHVLPGFHSGSGANAGRFLQKLGMDAVKLEGGRERLEAMRAIVSAGIR